MFGNEALQCIRSFDDRLYLKGEFCAKMLSYIHIEKSNPPQLLNLTLGVDRGTIEEWTIEEKATCWNNRTERKYCIHIESNAHRLNTHNILLFSRFSWLFLSILRLFRLFLRSFVQMFRLTESKLFLSLIFSHRFSPFFFVSKIFKTFYDSIYCVSVSLLSMVFWVFTLMRSGKYSIWALKHILRSLFSSENSNETYMHIIMYYHILFRPDGSQNSGRASVHLYNQFDSFFSHSIFCIILIWLEIFRKNSHSNVGYTYENSIEMIILW